MNEECKNCKYPRKGYVPQCVSQGGKFPLKFKSETGRIITTYNDKPLCLTSKEEALELLEKTQDEMDKEPEKIN